MLASRVKVVVAGASGLVGRQLVASLVEGGHEAVVLDGSTWDPTGQDLSWATALANATAVVDLSRHSRLGTINALVDAIASLPPPDRPRAFLSASSVAIYDGGTDEAITEATPVGRSTLAQACVARESAAFAAEVLAVRSVALRLGLVVGSGARLEFALAARGLFCARETWLPWVGIDDAVGLIVRAADGWDIEGPLNVVAPHPIRLPRGFGLPVPSSLRRAAIGRQADLLLTSRHVWPAKALKASFEFCQPDFPGLALPRLRLRPASVGYVVSGYAVAPLSKISAADRRGRPGLS